MDEHLNREHLISLVAKTSFRRRGTTTTCLLYVMGVPFPIEGVSSFVFREMYSEALGEKLAYENALEQLKKYERYALIRSSQSQSKEIECATTTELT